MQKIDEVLWLRGPSATEYITQKIRAAVEKMFIGGFLITS